MVKVIEPQECKRFRYFWCYGTITVTVLVAWVCRITYRAKNEDEFAENPDKRRLDWRFTFMQIDIITLYAIMWPLILQLFVLMVLCGSGLQLRYFKEVIIRHLISASLFLIYYHVAKYITENSENDFDPSGHIAVHLVAQTGHLSSYLFLRKIDLTDGHISTQNCFHRESTLLKYICLVIFIVFQTHACYSLFFTAFIFHTRAEAFVGWVFGMAISGLVYET